jgi:phosphohistidine phosphatase
MPIGHATPLTIAIARHGKAQQGSPTGRDRDRELMPRGEKQARFLGAALAKLAKPPTLIIASPVVRAKQTAELIHAELKAPLRFDERLASGAPASGVLEAALEACHADAACRPLMVGHNPTLEYLLALLTLGPEGDMEDMRHVRTGEAFVVRIADAASPIGTGKIEADLRLDDE